MRNEHVLQSQLEEYCKNGPYPMHMPGHKRQVAPAPDLPYAWDLTEVEGVDDLHHADGILRDAMERTSKLWKSRRTWYLVNGSTCGILASIYAAVPRGGEVILARNCHKSVYHAVELLDLKSHWLMPEYGTDWGIFGCVGPESVREMIRRYPESRAVVITSPTYEGIVSDIRSIAEICHGAGIPLIVDEAHGAHFGLFPEGEFPDSALHLGADLVIQSAHKTLPSLTQTALLHMGKDSMIPERAVDHALDLFETSSPSYPLMASLDGCTGILRERGQQLFLNWRKGIGYLDDVVSCLKHVEVFGRGKSAVSSCHMAFRSQESSGEIRHGGRCHGVEASYAYDDSRFLLRAGKNPKITGQELAQLLLAECGVESEMHCGRNVLLMTGCGDSAEGYARVGRALERLDEILSRRQYFTEEHSESSYVESSETREAGAGVSDGIEKTGKTHQNVLEEQDIVTGWQIDTVCRVADAEEKLRAGEAAKISLQKAAGRISAEYVMAYPPGIPVLIPGERITEEAIRAILYLNGQGSNMIWSVTEQNHASEELSITVVR